ncbi:MAG: type III pantothenate kinase [Finegoldia sp.]|nr:type III pantothenate kinase [Finegoldia sp.]
MLLAIDIGNTNIVFGVFNDENLVFEWRISTDKNKTSDEYGLLFKQVLAYSNIKDDNVGQIIIGSVVPDLTSTIVRAMSRYFKIKPMIVDSDTYIGIANKYTNPEEVGVDRLINCVAAFNIYKGASLVVDIGTAISFDYINENGEYLGGAIAPGLGIAAQALFSKTAKLPKIELEKPESFIGTTTEQSMQSGLVNGYIGLVDYLIEGMLKEKQKSESDVNIIATGGFSKLIMQSSRYIKKIDKMLTLEGLKIINDLNR